MYKRYLLIFSLPLLNTLSYSQNFRKEQLDYEESGVVAQFRGGMFGEGDKLPSPKLIFGV